MKNNSIIDKYTNIVLNIIETDVPMEERFKKIESLNNDFFNEVGENLPSFMLEMLGTWILKETYGDKRTNKVAVEEFPVLSESQLIRRHRKTVQIQDEGILETLNYHLRNNSSTSKRNEKRPEEVGGIEC